jgi:hypothetical protein
MSDLIERLRGRANMARDTHLVDAELDDKAADRIERLEAALKEIVRNDGDGMNMPRIYAGLGLTC